VRDVSTLRFLSYAFLLIIFGYEEGWRNTNTIVVLFLALLSHFLSLVMTVSFILLPLHVVHIVSSFSRSMFLV